MISAQVARGLLEAEQDRLLDVRRGLEADLLEEREGAGELSPLDQHQADVGSEVFERETELSILHRVEVDLVEVADALVRIDSGSYGTCQTCGAPISDERLDAVPATRFCADHQALWEGHRRTLSLPEGVYADGAESADVIAVREAERHLEFLPTDDEPDTAELLGPEEQALHATYLGTSPSEALAPDEVELAEMQVAGARSDERAEAQREADAQRAHAEAVLVDEDRLSAASSRRRPVLRRLARRRERR